jgi:hypothetical protein
MKTATCSGVLSRTKHMRVEWLRERNAGTKNRKVLIVHIHAPPLLLLYTPNSLFAPTTTKNYATMYHACLIWALVGKAESQKPSEAEHTLSRVFCPKRTTGILYEWVRTAKTCLKQHICPSSLLYLPLSSTLQHPDPSILLTTKNSLTNARCPGVFLSKKLQDIIYCVRET